jgi:hypothetical protein
MLLNLEHYDCHCFILRRSQCMPFTLFHFASASSPDLQAFSERKKKPLTPYNAGRRRHSDAALQPWVMRNYRHLRSAFRRAATITRVVVRLKSLVANKPKSDRNAYGPPTPRPRCGSCFCIYELLNSPLVVRRFFLVAKLPSTNRHTGADLRLSMLFQREHVGR